MPATAWNHSFRAHDLIGEATYLSGLLRATLFTEGIPDIGPGQLDAQMSVAHIRWCIHRPEPASPHTSTAGEAPSGHSAIHTLTFGAGSASSSGQHHLFTSCRSCPPGGGHRASGRGGHGRPQQGAAEDRPAPVRRSISVTA